MATNNTTKAPTTKAPKGKGKPTAKPVVGGKPTVGGKLACEFYSSDPSAHWVASAGNGDQTGMVNGLRLTQFVNELLYTQHDTARQVDNATLDAIFAAEYPNRPQLQSAQAYKSYYNGCRHGMGHASLPKLPRLSVAKVRIAPPAPPAPKAPSKP
jgi:hypothetical protein